MMTDEEKQEEMQRSIPAPERERRMREAEEAVASIVEALNDAWLKGGVKGLREKWREMNSPSLVLEDAPAEEQEGEI